MACDLNRVEDLRQILDAAALVLNAEYPLSRLRHEEPDDLAKIAEFGAFRLGFAEQEPESGLGLVEEGLLNVLFGRHLLSTRALAASVSTHQAAEFGRRDLAEKLCSAELVICAAVPFDDSVLLIDPGGAHLAVVFGQRRLTLIEIAGRPGERMKGLGQSVNVTRMCRDGLAVVGECLDGKLLDIADLLISAQLLGIAEATCDLAVSYAQMRQQFGRPIGSFQAIKHHCANMALAAEALSSLLDMAAIALRDGRDDAAFQVAALRWLAPETALANARACIQIHGGMGFSADSDAHRFLKQAHVLSRLGAGGTILELPPALAPHISIKEGN
jgi:hypothetical protein